MVTLSCPSAKWTVSLIVMTGVLKSKSGGRVTCSLFQTMGIALWQTALSTVTMVVCAKQK